MEGAAAEEPPPRTLADVGIDDAAYRQEQAGQAFEPEVEAAALLEICDSAALRQTCQQQLGQRWGLCEQKMALWRGQPAAALGAAIGAVVTHLDAPHLKPVGMRQRLQDGVDAT